MSSEAISASQFSFQFSPQRGREVSSAMLLLISNIVLVLTLSSSAEAQNTPEAAPPCGGYYGEEYLHLHQNDNDRYFSPQTVISISTITLRSPA